LRFTLFLTIQSSSLWARLTIVPLRFLLIIVIRVKTISELTLIIFVIVFIGGLIVLLVSVSAMVRQEQSISLSIRLLLVLLITESVLILSRYDWRHSFVTLLNTLTAFNAGFISLSLILLIQGLLTISVLLVEFKRLIRKI